MPSGMPSPLASRLVDGSDTAWGQRAELVR